MAASLAGASWGRPAAKAAAAKPAAAEGSRSVHPSALLTISNGTDHVVIGGETVVFPTTVTDAAWSPNGARLAFVDADGNIDTARPDGSGLMVLTPTEPGVTRSHPAWVLGRTTFPAQIDYAEKGPDGISRLYTVAASGQDVDDSGTPTETQIKLPIADSSGNSSPAASESAPEIVYYQHQGASQSQIMAYDGLRTTMMAGSEPALSPDGKWLAFIGPNGQIDVASVEHGVFSLSAAQITFGASSPTGPAWSPDGKTIAYRTKTDVETVPVAVPAGARTNPPTIVSKTPGVPTYRPVTATTLVRVVGADAVAQSVAVSRATWPNQPVDYPRTKVVFIAPAALTQDDLALAALYSREYPSGPLLLNPPGDLDPRVKAEITRVLGVPKTVSTDAGKPLILQSITILGDTDGISADAESQLQAMGYNVARDDSADVVADSLDFAARLVTPTDNMQISVPVYLVASDDPASICVASAASRRDEGLIVYTDSSTLRSDTRAFLDAIEPFVGHETAQVYAIGQEAVAAVGSWTPGPSKALTNFVGATPAATAAAALKALGVVPSQVTLVNPDSLVDTALALFDGGVPLAIDPAAGSDSDVAAWLNANSTTIGAVWLDGDTDTMPDSTASAVTDALAPASLKSVDNPLAVAQDIPIAPKDPRKTPATRPGRL